MLLAHSRDEVEIDLYLFPGELAGGLWERLEAAGPVIRCGVAAPAAQQLGMAISAPLESIRDCPWDRIQPSNRSYWAASIPVLTWPIRILVKEAMARKHASVGGNGDEVLDDAATESMGRAAGPVQTLA